ncbi:hypothetical protein LCGC14_1753710 [marine sediment metagenome]|uniref:DUF2190 domain-containing protein n=1 Tax=marine sediment metagenome TaxID=412755 RepID=A0A0F9K2N6_9ZZZZ
MAGASYVLDKTYKIEDAAGVGQYLAVVTGAADGGCKKPAAANEAKFVGFTQEAQANQNKGVTVRVMGISRAVAKSAIANGDWVRIAENTGKIESAQADVIAAVGTEKVNHCIGMAEAAAAADEDIIPVRIQPMVAKTAVT